MAHHKHKKVPLLISSMALFKAAENKNIAGVQYLLEHGISPNVTNPGDFSRDETILYWAVREENDSIVKLLLLKGANPNTVDRAGSSPLLHAAECSYTALVKILLEHGAFVNIEGSWSFTPLHLAIFLQFRAGFDATNNINTIKLLLQYGASLTAISTKKNKTPLDYVEEVRVDSKALLNLEQLYRDKELHKIAEKTYINAAHIQDFVKWKAGADIPKYIKSNVSLLSKNIQKLFALNKFLQDNSLLVSNKETKLLEKKIQEYVGYQNLAETKQPIFTLKHFSTLKLIQSPEECSEHFSKELPPHTIEIIGKLEQDYGINLSGVTEGN